MTTRENKDEGYIFQIQKMSTEDGPGIRTTVFFKGCPLSCAWCHNPESISKKPSIQWFPVKCIGCETCVNICPQHALKLTKDGIIIDRELCNECGICVDECPSTALKKFGEKKNLDELFAEVVKDKVFYVKSNGGITASGGEAALQSNFILKFFKKCKEEDINTALDLSGILPKINYEKLLPYTDLFLYDIKEIDNEKHMKFTGLSNTIILENLMWLVKELENRKIDAKIWIRTPIIPEFTATEENIKGIGTFIVRELENKIDRWDLLSYNNLAKDKYERMNLDYKCKDIELLTKEDMEYFYEIAKSTGVKNVHWSGLTKNKGSKMKDKTPIPEKISVGKC